ncbi:MAG: hypothetical protein ACOX9R_17490 [Armatimonadota bacterium]|jgi:hypothetical protein
MRARAPRSLARLAAVGGLLALGASFASAQEIIASTRQDVALAGAIAAALLLPVAEAAVYRLAVKALFLRALGLCVVLNLAAYGLIVLWLNYLPGGVNPLFARMIYGEQSGFSPLHAAVAAILYAAAFVAVKVPALIWWLRRGGPDERITITVLLTNLVLFFAMVAVVGVIVNVLA